MVTNTNRATKMLFMYSGPGIVFEKSGGSRDVFRESFVTCEKLLKRKREK